MLRIFKKKSEVFFLDELSPPASQQRLSGVQSSPDALRFFIWETLEETQNNIEIQSPLATVYHKYLYNP